MDVLPTIERPVSQGILQIPGGPSYPLGQLPDGRTLADDLEAALPDLQVWLACALEYYRLGRGEDFVTILERTQKPEVNQRLSDHHEEAARVLNALAGYYIMETGDRDPQVREDALHEVTKWISRANRLDSHVLTATSSSLSNLLSGKLDTAENHLEGVPDSTLATMLVRAAVHYGRGEYHDALRQFAKALRANPRAPASVRFGLGLCYYRLNRPDVAEKCFLRALQLNDQLIEPRVALAILKLNTGDVAQVQPAMKLLQDAFRIDDQHPRVLNLFADHYVYRREFEKVVKLAERARSNTDLDRILSESEYHLGRARHAEGQFAAAHTHFQEAVDKDPNNLLARISLAQVLLHDGKVQEAQTCLEVLLKRVPDDCSTLQLLGTVQRRLGNSEAAVTLLQRAIDADTTDPDALIEFAQLMERSEPQKSLMAYRAALQLLLERGTEKAELLNALRNNVAVMHQQLGEFDQALGLFRQIFCEEDASANELENLVADKLIDKSVTISFNLARLYEEMHRTTQAKELYSAILTRHVAYTDCYLRLSTIARKEGDRDGAMEHLQSALTVHNDLPDALAMMGNLLIENHELHAAQLKFERILERADRHDQYALVSLGNIYYMARVDRKDRKARNLKFASESYWKVLKVDSTNLYAANGIGIVFAAEGRLGAAGDIFTRVREGSSSMGDVVVNLAHIHVAQGEFQKAIILYESALRRHFANSHPKILLYLSRAYFESQQYDQAQEYLARCMEQWAGKDSAGLQFNLGLIKERRARMVLDDDLRDPELVMASLAELKEAKEIFDQIIATSKREEEAAAAIADAEDAENVDGDDEAVSSKRNTTQKARSAEREFMLANCEKHSQKCAESIAKGDEKIQKAKQVYEEEVAARKSREDRMRQREQEKEEARRRRREMEEKKAQELAAIAEKEQVILQEEMVHWKPLSSSTGRQVSGAGAGAGAGGGDDDGGAPRERKAGSGRKKKTKRRDGSLAEELADLTPSAKSRKHSGDEEDGSGDGSAADEGPATTAPSGTSQAPAALEDDDDDFEEWQKAIMNPKLSSIMESKRVRDDEKRGYSKRRRPEGAGQHPTEATAPAPEEGVGGEPAESVPADKSSQSERHDEGEDDELMLADDE